MVPLYLKLALLGIRIYWPQIERAIGSLSKPDTPAVTGDLPPGLPAPRPRRVALLIGNNAYGDGARLRNCVSDAVAVGECLSRLGFETRVVTDATKEAIMEAVEGLGEHADDPEACLVFFSGHGIEQDGVNYLVPTDARLSAPPDARQFCCSADDILARMAECGYPLKILVLDACRVIPFKYSRHRGLPAAGGLGMMNGPSGTIIAYATGAGMVAEDGEGPHSPFTAALLHALDGEPVKAQDLFNNVSTDVCKATGDKQKPWTYSCAVRGDFYFRV